MCVHVLKDIIHPYNSKFLLSNTLLMTVSILQKKFMQHKRGIWSIAIHFVNCRHMPAGKRYATCTTLSYRHKKVI